MESDCMLRNTGNGSLVQLVDNEKKFKNSPYIGKNDYVYFEEERPGIILDSFRQGNVTYYKVMLVYTGYILAGVPEELLKDNQLVL